MGNQIEKILSVSKIVRLGFREIIDDTCSLPRFLIN